MESKMTSSSRLVPAWAIGRTADEHAMTERELDLTAAVYAPAGCAVLLDVAAR